MAKTRPNSRLRPELTKQVDLEDIEYIIDNLRIADRAEAEALNIPVGPTLRQSVHLAHVAMTLVDPKTGRPGAILGAGPVPIEGYGIIWCVGTDAIVDNALVFMRQSREVLPTLFDRLGVTVLGNIVHVKNEVHIKWLRWLGAKFLRRFQYGPYGEEFYEFVFIKE